MKKYCKKSEEAANPVMCDEICDKCGWNPREHRRRLHQGRWEIIYTRNDLETGAMKKYPKGLRHLVFPNRFKLTEGAQNDE